MNFYKRYPGDYMRDTADLTLAEHGAYSMMLDLYYSTETPLRNVPDLYRILRAAGKREKVAIDSIIERFWDVTPYGLINLRAHEEIVKACNIREKNKRNGCKGGRPAKSTANPAGTQSVIPGYPKHIPSTKQHQTPDSRHINHRPEDAVSPPLDLAAEAAQWEAEA